MNGLCCAAFGQLTRPLQNLHRTELCSMQPLIPVLYQTVTKLNTKACDDSFLTLSTR